MPIDLELTDAIYDGDTGAIERMLDGGASPDGVDSTRQSALLIAVLEDNLELVRLFLSRGATVDTEPNPLDYVDEGSEIEALLLAAGAKISSTPTYDPADGVRALAWSGFYSEAEIVEFVEETGMDTGGLSREELCALVRTELQARVDAESQWPDLTDCDRLDRAFEALGAAGIVAVHNAELDECLEAFDRRGGVAAGLRGVVHYAVQDLERVYREQVLWLSFAGVDGKSEQAVAVAKEAQRVLEEHGLHTLWSGAASERMRIEPMRWQRRGISSRWRQVMAPS